MFWVGAAGLSLEKEKFRGEQFENQKDRGGPKGGNVTLQKKKKEVGGEQGIKVSARKGEDERDERGSGKSAGQVCPSKKFVVIRDSPRCGKKR